MKLTRDHSFLSSFYYLSLSKTGERSESPKLVIVIIRYNQRRAGDGSQQKRRGRGRDEIILL